MTQDRYDYVIVGAGLAGASAVEGIRQHDKQGSILLAGAEPQRPYNRPPLSKQLWTGKETLEKIFIHGAEFYERERVDLALATQIDAVDAGAREIRDRQGRRYRYGKLLLATGGSPRRLPIPGGGLDGLSYFRTYDDYVQPGAPPRRRRRPSSSAGASSVRRSPPRSTCPVSRSAWSSPDHTSSTGCFRSRSPAHYSPVSPSAGFRFSPATGPCRSPAAACTSSSAPKRVGGYALISPSPGSGSRPTSRSRRRPACKPATGSS